MKKKGYKSIANATKIDRYCCFVNHKTTQHKKKNSETDEQDELHRMVKSRRKKCNQNDWHWIIASNFSHFLVRHFHLCAHLVAVRVFFHFAFLYLPLLPLLCILRWIFIPYFSFARLILHIYVREWDQVTVSENTKIYNNRGKKSITTNNNNNDPRSSTILVLQTIKSAFGRCNRNGLSEKNGIFLPSIARQTYAIRWNDESKFLFIQNTFTDSLYF